MHWVQRALPTTIPFITLQQTPAQMLQSIVDHSIQSFQDGVDRRAAARQADPRSCFAAEHSMCCLRTAEQLETSQLSVSCGCIAALLLCCCTCPASTAAALTGSAFGLVCLLDEHQAGRQLLQAAPLRCQPYNFSRVIHSAAQALRPDTVTYGQLSLASVSISQQHMNTLSATRIGTAHWQRGLIICWCCCCRGFLRRLLDSLTSWKSARSWLHSQTPSWWGLVMLLFIGHFVKDCIEQFAQSQASYEHDLQLRAKAHSLKRDQ